MAAVVAHHCWRPQSLRRDGGEEAREVGRELRLRGAYGTVQRRFSGEGAKFGRHLRLVLAPRSVHSSSTTVESSDTRQGEGQGGCSQAADDRRL